MLKGVAVFDSHPPTITKYRLSLMHNTSKWRKLGSDFSGLEGEQATAEPGREIVEWTF